MPYSMDANGLILKTNDQLYLTLVNGMKDIFGDTINVASDSPDGQFINLFKQAVLDVQDILQDSYNSFDPDQAIGNTLDQRAALTGVKRQTGSFTLTPITVVADRPITLAGLDSEISLASGTGFTVADALGNNFILTSTTTFAAAGTAILTFRAQNMGAVYTIPNTLTSIVTGQLGVISANNPSSYSSLGTPSELDPTFRYRRRKSNAISSEGYFDALTALLENTSGVTYAKVYENNTPNIVDTIPPNGIWCIVEGGSDADIALAIYKKRNMGVTMKGDEQSTIVRADGSTFVVRYDRTDLTPLYIEFSATSISGVDVDEATLKASLVTNLVFDVYGSINVNYLAEEIRAINPDVLATGIGVSTDGITFGNIVYPTAKNYRFSLQASDIDITVV